MSQKRKIVYVVRDIERALGMAPCAEYVIVSNRTPYAEIIKGRYPDFVHLVEEEGATEGNTLDTLQLLKSTVVKELMSGPDAALLVFKNNPLIEAITMENGWKLLNPSSALAEKVENKITQVEWLGPLAEQYLPAHTVAPAKELVWNKEPLVVQWAHGHTGDGTILVNSANELRALQRKFPDRPARASSFVRGPSFTVNIVVAPDGIGTGNILIGNPSYQLTGLPPFTDQPFATVGNDWSMTHSLLSETEIIRIEDMARAIGEKMRADGWRGLFGIDVMRDDDRDAIFLIEINARQPASASFESFLQEENRRQGAIGSIVFEAHIVALLGEAATGASARDATASNDSLPLIPINDGAQIVQRVTEKIRSLPDDAVGSFELAGYTAIPYPNTELGADLLRIQSMRGIMETHGRFNARGKEILKIISNFRQLAD